MARAPKEEDTRLTARLVASARRHLGQRWWLWVALLLIGVGTNFGTAVWRLPAIRPGRQPVDFAAYYVGAWAMRWDISPYFYSPDIVESLAREHGLTPIPAPPMSSPPWVWMSQVFTFFSFPIAAWLWLLIGLAVMVLSTKILVSIAGYPGWRPCLLILPFTASFGPVFHDLTNGQNATLILLAALLVGRYLAGTGVRAHWVIVVWTMAVAAKIYPLFWAAALPVARKWTMLVSIVVVCVAFSAIVGWLHPGTNRDYWLRLMPERAQELREKWTVNDQSLEARIAFIASTQRVSLLVMDGKARHDRIWRPPWQLPAGAVTAASLIIIIALAGGMVVTWARAERPRHNEGLFYMLVLFWLLPFPHMETYNHVLLLPAMAWLWRCRGTYRSLTVIAYCLAGLARLNRIWAVFLPWPLGPVATGGYAWAILVLGAGIAHFLISRQDSQTPLGQAGTGV